MRPLIAGNWKMNLRRGDAVALAAGIVEKCAAEPDPGCDLLVCPPAPMLHAVAEQLAGSPVSLGAQDCHAEQSGAHTGDISAAMLADAGCVQVIVGHSERRADHREDDALVKAKAAAAHKEGLGAIICIGETLAQRDAGEALNVVGDQLASSLPDAVNAENTVIAYEPIWAIGTGLTPTTEQIDEVHNHIRALLVESMGDGANVRILYGGSVKPDNAAAIMVIEHVNGGLIGGASLTVGNFWGIAAACR